MRYRCAVLDDYQNVALTMADWSLVRGDVDVTVFNERTGEGAVVEDRENTGLFSVVIEAEPCDFAWAKQEDGQDTSGRTNFTVQEKSQDLLDDPNACK